MDIQVDNSDWGGVQPELIKVILETAADALLRPLTQKPTFDVFVDRQPYPVAAYAEKNGRKWIGLAPNTTGTYWGQYVYQFAHELCHCISNHKNEHRYFKWLEESMCELASWYVLDELAVSWAAPATWENRPGYSFLANGAHIHRDYYKETFDGVMKLEVPFDEWFRIEYGNLRGHATQRYKNKVIARELKSIFFNNSGQAWNVIRFLNTFDEVGDLKRYFIAWQSKAENAFRPAIKEIAQVFGVVI